MEPPLYIFLAICLSAIVIFMIFDLLLLSGEVVVKDVRPLSPYTGPIITFFMVIILGSRLARNVKKIETFNAQLEMKVQQVSNDLSSSLNEKHQLELALLHKDLKDNTLLIWTEFKWQLGYEDDLIL